MSGAQPSRRRAVPAVVHHVRPQRRVRVLVVEIRRRHEELEALRVGRRGAVALVHVPAADPLRARRDADLVPGAVVSDRRSRRVRAVRVVVAGHRAVRAADAAARVDRVVPVVVVVGRGAVPAPVVRLERVVRPAHPGVLVADHDSLPRVAERPDLGRVDLRHARLDCVGPGASARRLRLEPPGAVVRLDHAHVRAGGESLDQRPVASRSDHVRRPVRCVRGLPRLEQRADRGLCPCGVPLEGPVDVPATSVLVPHRIRGAQIGLVAQLDDERGVLPAGRVLQNLRIDLRPAATGRGPADQQGDADDRNAERGGESDSAGHEPSLRDHEQLSHIAAGRRSRAAAKSEIAAYNGRACPLSSVGRAPPW